MIDFIDMEENRNNRAVEKKLKDCLKDDRARIQVGRISAFGLLEMSRQRIRTGVLESSSVPCPHCAGAGMIRSTPSVALQILRALEETLIKSASHNLNVRTRPEVALYVLNQKRLHLSDLETRFGIAISISVDAALLGTRYFEVERGEFVGNEGRVVPVTSIKAEAVAADIDDEALDAAAEAEALGAEAPVAATQAVEDGEQAERGDGEGRGEGGRKRRRRRRRRRGGERDANGQRLDNGSDSEGDEDGEDDNDAEAEQAEGVAAVEASDAEASTEAQPVEEAAPADAAKPKRARGGRRKAKSAEGEAVAGEAVDAGAADAETAPAVSTSEAPAMQAPDAAEAEPTKPKRSRARKKVVPITEDGAAAEAVAEPAPEAAAPPAAAPVQAEAAPEPEPEPAPAPKIVEEPVAVVLTPPDPDRPKRGGWWNKLTNRS